MATPLPFEKEKLILGVLYYDDIIYDKALTILKERFGDIDFETEEFSFSEEFSDYYDEELGGGARRKIFSFENTVDPSRQAEIKKFTKRGSITGAYIFGKNINFSTPHLAVRHTVIMRKLGSIATICIYKNTAIGRYLGHSFPYF